MSWSDIVQQAKIKEEITILEKIKRLFGLRYTTESGHINAKFLIGALHNCKLKYKPFIGGPKDAFINHIMYYPSASRKNVLNFIIYGKIVDLTSKELKSWD
jgi:hypothetical protein